MFDMRRQERVFTDMPTYELGLPNIAPPELTPEDEFGGFFDQEQGGDLTGTGDPPIQLSGEDLARFEFRFFAALDNARSRMWEIHKAAERDRKVYSMMTREPEYDGGPDVTTPLSANKADGVLAHLRDAMEQRPLASFNPEGIGSAGENATQVAHLCQSYMEREINRSGSRERIIAHMGREATQVGTGISRLAVTAYPDEDFVQFSRTIRLEDFYVDRIMVDTLKDTFCAYEYKERMYNIQAQAEIGLLDRDRVEELAQGGISDTTLVSKEEEEWNFYDTGVFSEENQIKTLATGWMRFRPAGQQRAVLYEAVVHPSTRKLLAVRLNSARHAYDAPPIALFRIGKQAGTLFGRGIVRRLEAEQKMADNAINNHMALNNLAASPPFLYRMNSPFGKALQRSGQRGIMPGMGIPTANSPDKGDVQVMDQFRNGGLNLQDMDIAFGFADRATYTEEAIGSQSDPRKTLGQFQVEVQKGTMRLRVDVADFAYDAAQALTMYWSMIVAHKIAPRGVVEIEQGGSLIASDDIEQDELMETLVESLTPMVASGEITPMDLQELDAEFGQKLTDGMIPGVRRTDLTISLTGTKIIADRVGELEMLFRLTPYITSLMQAAAQDSYINYHLRSILRAMGFSDIDKRMPADPGQILENGEERERMVMMMNELMAKSAVA